MTDSATRRGLEFMLQRLESGEVDTLVCFSITKKDDSIAAVVALPGSRDYAYQIRRLEQIHAACAALLEGMAERHDGSS